MSARSALKFSTLSGLLLTSLLLATLSACSGTPDKTAAPTAEPASAKQQTATDDKDTSATEQSSASTEQSSDGSAVQIFDQTETVDAGHRGNIAQASLLDMKVGMSATAVRDLAATYEWQPRPRSENRLSEVISSPPNDATVRFLLRKPKGGILETRFCSGKLYYARYDGSLHENRRQSYLAAARSQLQALGKVDEETDNRNHTLSYAPGIWSYQAYTVYRHRPDQSRWMVIETLADQTVCPLDHSPR